MNSIIIPHRGRLPFLRQCLASIEWCAEACGRSDYEVLVSHNGPPPESRPGGPRVRWLLDGGEMPIFCKPRLLNLGIREAAGDILTFLDADAIVGPSWLAGVSTLDADRALTLLAYRVRYLPARARITDRATWLRLFQAYDRFPRGYEAYGGPDGGQRLLRPQPAAPVVGNSQCSIRRQILGDLRWDERYVGRGAEDRAFLRALLRRAGTRFRSVLRTEPQFSLFHLRHDYAPDWRTREIEKANHRLYHSEA